MPKSTGLTAEKQHKEVKEYFMDQNEKKAYDFYISKFRKARQQREKTWEYFDDLTFEQDYYLNKRAANTYLRPKKNDDEVRINTGVTEKRIEGVANELISMNLQPEVRAYDENDQEIEELGDAFSDLVKRTNEIEQDDDKYADAILELLTQRAVFVEEIYLDKEVGRGKDKKQIQRCEKRLLSGLQVYLGNIRLPHYRFKDQPYIVKYERMSYREAEGLYGHKANFEYVTAGNYSAYGDNFSYRMAPLESDEVEILHYMSYPDDEYQVMINGVMIWELAAKLPWRYEGYNISMTVLKPMAIDFSYGKPLTASAKTLQALDNETLRNLVRKFRQAIEPPMGTKSSRIFSRDIWNPGSITQGVRKEDISTLIDHQGVTGSEMGMMNLIEQKTNEFLGTSSIQAAEQRKGGKGQATAIVSAQKEAVKMLGFAVLSVIRLKKNLTFLRIYNILENETQPTGKRKNELTNKIENTYKMFTVHESKLNNGRTGKKVIQFTDQPISDDMTSQIYQAERQSEMKGEDLNIVVINAEQLNDIVKNWFISVKQTDKDSSELAKAMFKDQIGQAQAIAQLTGRQLNPDKLIESFERKWQIKDLFQKQAPQQPVGQPQPGQAPAGKGSEAGSQLSQGIAAANGAPQHPSINSMVNAV